jgi:hypothetical protein
MPAERDHVTDQQAGRRGPVLAEQADVPRELPGGE